MTIFDWTHSKITTKQNKHCFEMDIYTDRLAVFRFNRWKNNNTKLTYILLGHSWKNKTPAIFGRLIYQGTGSSQYKTFPLETSHNYWLSLQYFWSITHNFHSHLRLNISAEHSKHLALLSEWSAFCVSSSEFFSSPHTKKKLTLNRQIHKFVYFITNKTRTKKKEVTTRLYFISTIRT